MSARPPYRRHLAQMIVQILARRARLQQPEATVQDLTRALSRQKSSVLYALNTLIREGRVGKRNDKGVALYRLED